MVMGCRGAELGGVQLDCLLWFRGTRTFALDLLPRAEKDVEEKGILKVTSVD